MRMSRFAGVRMLSGAMTVLLVAPLVLLWSAPTAAAADLTATLVRTVATSSFDPPSPDPSGITYNSGRDTLLISDAEVEEVSIYEGVNLFETTRAGVLLDTGVTTPYSKEPAGVGYNPVNGHAFVSDDDQARVYELAGGPDGRYGTSDDIRTTFSAAAFGGGDSEEVEFFPPTGEVFVLEGADTDVHRISPGPDGLFNGVAPAGDDIDTEFDVGRFGADDPEGLGFYPGRNTLLVVDSTSETAYEFNRNMQLVNKIDISASTRSSPRVSPLPRPPTIRPAGISTSSTAESTTTRTRPRTTGSCTRCRSCCRRCPTSPLTFRWVRISRPM